MRFKARGLLGSKLVAVVVLGFGMLPPTKFAAPGAEPAWRFLGVQGWKLTYTMNFSWNGQLGGMDGLGGCWGPGTSTWSFNDQAAVTTILDRDRQNADVTWTASLPITAGTVSLAERASAQFPPALPGCPPYNLEKVANNAGPIDFPPSLVMLIAPRVQPHYFLYCGGATAEVTETVAGMVFGPGPSGSDLGVVHQTSFPDSGWVIQGSSTEDDRPILLVPYWLSSTPGPKCPPKSFTWRLEAILEDLQLVVSLRGYDSHGPTQTFGDWLPEGNLKRPGQRGGFVMISAELQKAGGGPADSAASSLLFELVQSSSEPGVCLNYPPSFASSEPDFKFETELNTFDPVADWQATVTPTSVETFIPDWGIQSAHVFLSCFDFGAYGVIRVTAKMPGRDPIVGYLKGDAQKRPNILLPQRQDNSFIADAWKKRVDIHAAGLADDDDSDDLPMGDSHKGDGLSLYEEYRGFVIRGQHLRANPNLVDLFVRNQAGVIGDLGALTLQNASGLTVHLVQADEFGSGRVINFNHAAHHLVDQHGIELLMRLTNTGFSEAVGDPLYAGVPRSGTPGSGLYVALEPLDTFLHRPAGSFGLGSDGTASVKRNPAYAPLGALVAHELAHRCCLYHHGDSPNGLSIARVVAPLDRPSGLYTVSLDGVNRSLRLLNENNTPRSHEGVGSVYGIGRTNSAYSGNDQCFMRYNDAAGYFSYSDPSGTVYLFDQPEELGSSLCHSPAGTGVNAPAAGLPWPRYGDADGLRRRGNCQGQICVNDVYVLASEHNR